MANFLSSHNCSLRTTEYYTKTQSTWEQKQQKENSRWHFDSGQINCSLIPQRAPKKFLEGALMFMLLCHIGISVAAEEASLKKDEKNVGTAPFPPHLSQQQTNTTAVFMESPVGLGSIPISMGQHTPPVVEPQPNNIPSSKKKRQRKAQHQIPEQEMPLTQNELPKSNLQIAERLMSKAREVAPNIFEHTQSFFVDEVVIKGQAVVDSEFLDKFGRSEIQYSQSLRDFTDLFNANHNQLARSLENELEEFYLNNLIYTEIESIDNTIDSYVDALKMELHKFQALYIEHALTKQFKGCPVDALYSVTVTEALHQKEEIDLALISITNPKQLSDYYTSIAIGCNLNDQYMQPLDPSNENNDCAIIDYERGYPLSMRSYYLDYKDFKWDIKRFSRSLLEPLEVLYPRYPQLRQIYAEFQKRYDQMLGTGVKLPVVSLPLNKEELSAEAFDPFSDSLKKKQKEKRGEIKKRIKKQRENELKVLLDQNRLLKENYEKGQALLNVLKGFYRLNYPLGCFMIPSQKKLQFGCSGENLPDLAQHEELETSFKVVQSSTHDLVMKNFESELDEFYEKTLSHLGIISLDNKIENYLVNLEEEFIGLQYLLVHHALVERFRAGRVGSLASYMSIEALRRYENIVIEVVDIQDTMHKAHIYTFIVLGRAPNTVLKDPMTWNQECVVIDSLVYEEAIPAEKLQKDPEKYKKFFIKNENWILLSKKFSRKLPEVPNINSNPKIKQLYNSLQKKYDEMLKNGVRLPH